MDTPAEQLSNEALAVAVEQWKRDMFRWNEAAGTTGTADIPTTFWSRYSPHAAIGGFSKADKGLLL